MSEPKPATGGAARRRLGSAVRLAVILAAVGWLYKQTRWSDLQSVLTNADWHLALVGLLAFAPVNVLIAQRLRWLLAVHDIHLPAWQAVKITFVGNFLIQALPVGTSGGDAVKAWFVARRTTRKHEAITSVFVDRVVGVVGLVLLSAVMVLLNWRNAALADSARYVGWMLLLLAVGGVVYFSRRLRRALRLEQIIARLPLAGHLQRIDQAVFAFRRGYRSVAGCLLLTMLLQVSAIVSTFLCGWALGLVGDRPVAAFPLYLAYVPICFLSGFLPLGGMEVLYVQLLSRAGGLGPEAAALSLSLMSRLVQLIWALPGGLAILTGQIALRPPGGAEEPAAEVHAQV